MKTREAYIEELERIEGVSYLNGEDDNEWTIFQMYLA